MARASRVSAALASPAHLLGAAFRDDRAVRVGEVDPNPEPSWGMACERAQNSGILSEEQPAVGENADPTHCRAEQRQSRLAGYSLAMRVDGPGFRGPGPVGERGTDPAIGSR